MDYAQGSIGRIFAARLHDGEEPYAAIEELAALEGVGSALVLLVGGARSARVVTGPKEPTGPVEPVLREFDDAREVLGVGTICPSDEGPKLHLHAGFGRGDQALVGCPRYGLQTYLVMEAVVIEMSGLNASREPDPQSGLKLLAFLSPKTIGPCPDR
jgi:predicted DNA-binding protein with PD1-like motif